MHSEQPCSLAWLDTPHFLPVWFQQPDKVVGLRLFAIPDLASVIRRANCFPRGFLKRALHIGKMLARLCASSEISPPPSTKPNTVLYG